MQIAWQVMRHRSAMSTQAIFSASQQNAGSSICCFCVEVCSEIPMTGDLAGRSKPHANQLVDASGLATNYRALVSGHTHSKYFADAPSLAGLRSWKAEYRYYDEDHSDYPKISEQDWKTASHEIQSALDAAMLDGHPIY